MAYPTVEEAVCYVFKRYRSLQLTIRHAEKILKNLERLANADLFWDPIVSIERIRHHESYVYDMTVDNEVFAGTGGWSTTPDLVSPYMVKLGSRWPRFDTEVIIIDPENEYESNHARSRRRVDPVSFRHDDQNLIPLSGLVATVILKRRPAGREFQRSFNQKVLSFMDFSVVMGSLTPSEDLPCIYSTASKGITLIRRRRERAAADGRSA
jgi:hypothetical protein